MKQEARQLAGRAKRTDLAGHQLCPWPRLDECPGSIQTRPACGTADSGDIANVSNQSGLSVGYVSGVTDIDTHIATHPSNIEGNAWGGLRGPQLGYIDFDLGDIFAVESCALWTQNNPNGIDAFNIWVDGVLAGNFNAALVGTRAIPAQVFTFGPLTGQIVRLEVLSNHGGLNRLSDNLRLLLRAKRPLDSFASMYSLTGNTAMTGRSGIRRHRRSRPVSH